MTDAYLLALAVRRQGRLVTLDRAVPLAAVPGATDHHLVRLQVPGTARHPPVQAGFRRIR